MKWKALSLSRLLLLGALGFSACTSSHPTTSPTPKPSTANTNGETTGLSPAQGREHAEYVRQTIARLDALEMNNDQDSLNAILAEMKNPDPQIRTAALAATVQFDDRSVIPKLQAIAAETVDPNEKAAILKAIDYLKLPSFAEYQAERQAMRTAGHTNPPAISTPATNAPQPAPGQP